MNKAIALADEGTEIGITGACAGKTKGRIYVEGFSEPHLMQAVSGIRMLMIYTMTIVPINDMTSIMEVKSKKKPVKRGQWVRCTRGHFKGDLARVEEVLGFITSHAPAVGSIHPDASNGRWFLVHPLLGRRSISWSERGHSLAAGMCLHQL